MMYSIGNFVKTNHFNNGICQVIDPDEAMIKSLSSNQINPQDFITLRQLSSGITLIYLISKVFPLDNIVDFEASLDKYSQIEVTEFSRKYTWNKRYNELSAKLKDNTLESKFFCLKQLLSTPMENLCFGERKLIEQLIQYLATEYSIIKNCTRKEAFLIIEKKIEMSLSWVKHE